MTQLSNLRVFATHPHPCSYLPGERATTLFIDPNTHIDGALYSELSELGFRRSGPHVYRPHCARCRACVPARIPVADFQPNRSQRRIWHRNKDLRVSDEKSIDGDEYYGLYERYISARHHDGDMYPPSREQFDSFLTSEWDLTHYYCFRRGDQLLAVAVVDQMSNGLSAIYTFYDPDENRRSLGTYAILWQIEQARQRELPAVYLGYWIHDCRKMNYKVQFRPTELLMNGHWSRLS